MTRAEPRPLGSVAVRGRASHR